MAVVYSALDTSCQRNVALKILRPAIAARRPHSTDLVKREAAAAVQLHAHTPHVVEVLTAGVTDDAHQLPYYVMERLHGSTLRTLIDDRRALARPFELLEVTDLATPIASALAEAHEQGIVHRDIKPENVYLAEQRDHTTLVKLLDFGISALADDEPGDPTTRTFSGSRRYASPEQLDGRPTTSASDVYSLGLVLFEMLTLSLPHDRLNPALSLRQVALNALQMPVPRTSKQHGDLPEQLDNIIGNCLEHSPSMRLTAEVVARKLRYLREAFEREVLGVTDYATDVSGPPVANFAQRAGNTTANLIEPPAAARPVEATVILPAAHEMFFLHPVVDGDADRNRTDPKPHVIAARAAAPVAPVVIPPWRDIAATVPPAPRRGVHPAALWMLLASCVVLMIVGAMVPSALARRARARQRAFAGPSSTVSSSPSSSAAIAPAARSASNAGSP